MVFAVLQPGNGSTTSGFLASTVGISGVAYGIFALRQRREGRGGNAGVATIGIVFGSIGTLVMAFYLITFMAGSPQAASPMSFFVNDMPLNPAPAAAAPAPVELAPVAGAPMDPVDSAPADAQQERMQMVQAAGTLAFAMRRLAPDQSWPTTLAVTTDTGTVLLPNGYTLGRLPAGTSLGYRTTSNGAGYLLTISGPLSGAIVEYSTETGLVAFRE